MYSVKIWQDKYVLEVTSWQKYHFAIFYTHHVVEHLTKLANNDTWNGRADSQLPNNNISHFQWPKISHTSLCLLRNLLECMQKI